MLVQNYVMSLIYEKVLAIRDSKSLWNCNISLCELVMAYGSLRTMLVTVVLTDYVFLCIIYCYSGLTMEIRLVGIGA